MAAIETHKIYAIKIRESADDGSDFSNPDTDYRMLFLGEDGNLHAKDSAGTVTTIGGGAGSLDLSGLTIEHNVQGNSDYVAGYDASAADERGFPVYALHGGPQLSVIFEECFYRANASAPPIYAGGVIEQVANSATHSAGTPSSNHPGVIDLNTGSNTAGRATLVQVTPSDQIVVGGGIIRFDAVLKLSALSDGTNTYSVRTGLGTSINAGDADGIYLRYTHGTNSGKWQGVCRLSGSESTVDTGITADTSFHRLGFVINAAANSVQFRVDGSDVGSPATTNIISAATRMTPATIVKSAGGTSRTLSIDYYRLAMEFTTAR